MVKPSQKPTTTTKVKAAPAAATKPMRKKGKRDAEDDLDIQVNPKKQKKVLVPALQKAKADVIKTPKKVKTSRFDSSDSEEEPDAKNPSLEVKAESSSEDESSSDEETASFEVVKTAKAGSSSSSSEDESSPDEETSPKQPVVKNVANGKPVTTDSSSSEEESEDEKEPATKKLAEASAKSKSDSDSDSSEEDFGDEDSDDGKPQKKKTSKQESTTSDESDEEESEDEKVEEEKAHVQPKTAATHTQGGGGRTLFVGNLSYQVETSDIVHFFKGAGEVVDVRLATYEDGKFRGFGHVQFASAEAAQKALKLSGKPLLGRDVRCSLAKEKGEQPTAQSRSGDYQSSGRGGASSQSKTIFVNGFNTSLSEKEIKIALRDHFKSCGEVTRIVLPADRETGAIKGMAFIDFKDGIDKALELSGSSMGGRRIKVGEGRARGEDKKGGDGGHFSKRGRGRDSGDGFSKRGRGRDSRGQLGRGRSGPITPSPVTNLAQGKKTVFDDE